MTTETFIVCRREDGGEWEPDVSNTSEKSARHYAEEFNARRTGEWIQRVEYKAFRKTVTLEELT
jgi:hypothetical protein